MRVLPAPSISGPAPRISESERSVRSQSPGSGREGSLLADGVIAKSDEVSSTKSHSYVKVLGGRGQRRMLGESSFQSLALVAPQASFLNSVSPSESTLPRLPKSVSKQRPLSLAESTVPCHVTVSLVESAVTKCGGGRGEGQKNALARRRARVETQETEGWV